MSRKIIIHVGMPKCASTYLQTHVFPNIEKINFMSFDHPFVAQLEKEIWNKNILLTKPLVLREEFERTEKELPYRDSLISSEAFVGRIFNNFSELKQNTDMLKNIFPEGRVFIIIRKQDSLASSAYKQSLYSGYSRTVKQFFNYHNGDFSGPQIPLYGAPAIDPNQLDLNRYISYYIDTFGKENVLVLPYEFLREDLKGFLKRFYEWTGFEPFYPVNEQMVTHQSLSLISCKIKLILNRFLSRPYNNCGFVKEQPMYDTLLKNQHKNKIYNMLYRMTANLTLADFLRVLDKIVYIPYEPLTKEMRTKILTKFLKSNEKLSKTIDFDLSKYGYF